MSGKQRKTAPRKRLRSYAKGATVFTLIFFLTGEIVLRIAYREGESFGSHGGPIVARFEKDFRFNRYDGPSRGPEVSGPKSTGGMRILVLGDSITWGQGVRNERDLYTNRLLDLVRVDVPDADMAVLAKPGREIDGHIEQIHKWGPIIAPDVVIYQWFINDMEVNKAERPGGVGRWSWLVFPRLLRRYSYLWFFLDYHFDRLQPFGRTYYEYINETYAEDAPGWQTFRSLFQQWANDAKQLTPRVLVVLYPSYSSSTIAFADFHDRVRRLAEDQGISTLDLSAAFSQREGNYEAFFASRFDSHPNEQAHSLMSRTIYQKMWALWPELFGQADPDAAQ